MSLDDQIQRLASRTATVLLLPSWGGFIYTLLHRPHQVTISGTTAFMPDVGLATIAILLCCLVTFACALPELTDDLTSASAWCRTLACAVPFFGMLAVLDPFGLTPAHG